MAANILAPGDTTDGGNPVLEIFFNDAGVLKDVFSLEFAIFERVTSPPSLVQTFPASGNQVVDIANLFPTGDKIGTGHYAANYTVPLGEPLGEHVIKWFFRTASGEPEQCFAEEFQVQSVSVTPGTGYCTIQDLRDEGVPAPPDPGGVTDARLQVLIDRAKLYIDKFTGRFFLPTDLTFTLDGSNTRSMLLEHPIIAVTEVAIEDSVIALPDLFIYNRHIAENLLNPDDRENPRIEINQPLDDDLLFKLGLKRFPIGQQNIRVIGTFGYTDFDGSAQGKTPDLICEATKLIVMGEIPVKFGSSGSVGAFSIVEEKTRDQSIKFADPNKLGAQAPGPFFGERRIDNILMMFKAPPRMRSV